MDLLDEIPQHRLRDFEIGDDAVFHRPDGDDVARRAAKHAFGLLTDGKDVGRPAFDGDDRRFAQNHALPFHVHEG